MKRIISAIVHDRPGVLNRVSSMFRRRGFNIASLAVGHSEKEGFSRMTIVVDNVEGMQADQITTQLDNVVEVVEAADITDHPTVIRETALIKVAATPSTRSTTTWEWTRITWRWPISPVALSPCSATAHRSAS